MGRQKVLAVTVERELRHHVVGNVAARIEGNEQLGGARNDDFLAAVGVRLVGVGGFEFEDGRRLLHCLHEVHDALLDEQLR